MMFIRRRSLWPPLTLLSLALLSGSCLADVPAAAKSQALVSQEGEVSSLFALADGFSSRTRGSFIGIRTDVITGNRQCDSEVIGLHDELVNNRVSNDDVDRMSDGREMCHALNSSMYDANAKTLRRKAPDNIEMSASGLIAQLGQPSTTVFASFLQRRPGPSATRHQAAKRLRRRLLKKGGKLPPQQQPSSKEHQRSQQEQKPPSGKTIITVDATRPGRVISADLWGTNLTIEAQDAVTVRRRAFVEASRQIAVSLIRWPGGNHASAYDWKTNELIKPGRRQRMDDHVDLADILRFVREIGAQLCVTINFGTMTAQDAADLVEFLNGPANSTWGAKRAALGFRDPINVRYFEIGNEENQPHMWYYSWTAENAYKYFFGGEEQRRGRYNNVGSQRYDPAGTKGDLFRVRGGANQVYSLRFPPVKDVVVRWFANSQALRNGTSQMWRQVADLGKQPPDAKVFALDAQAGLVRFGDGRHGAMPPRGSFFLVEYTTYGHDGFLDFARAMRAAPSSVPIQIGAAVLPFAKEKGGRPVPIAGPQQMREISKQMDFYVRHQYNSSIPVRDYGLYNYRRQIATDRLDTLARVHQRVARYVESLGLEKAPTIAVTEWNIFLNQDYWHINRTLEGGVIAAEWFIRLLNAGDTVPVAYGNQFALEGTQLALVRTKGNYSIAPMGYVFQAFSSWPGSRVLSTTVTAPEAKAYDKMVPYVAATAALSPDGRTLRIAAVNNAESTPLTAALQLTGFNASSARRWRLSGPRYDAGNDQNPANVLLREEPASVPLTKLSLPPHSVTFLELKGTLR